MDAEPMALAAREDEGGAPRPGEGLAVGAGGLRRPSRGDPCRVGVRPHDRPGVDGEVADAWPDVLPLLADDVVEAMYGAGPRAEGHRVVGEHAAAGLEVPAATRRFELTQPLQGFLIGGGHEGDYQCSRAKCKPGRREGSAALEDAQQV